MSDDETTPPIACSLNAAEMAERGDEIAALRAVSGRRTAHGVSLRFALDREAEVRDLARRESECCPFLDLQVVVEATAVRLDISGPEEARPIAEAFLELAGTSPTEA